MKTFVSISENGKIKKISAKQAKEKLGKERYEKMKKEALEAWYEDPFANHSFWLGGNNILYFDFLE